MSSFPFPFSLCKYLDKSLVFISWCTVGKLVQYGEGFGVVGNRCPGRPFASKWREPRLWFLNLFNIIFLLTSFLAYEC